MLSDRFLGGSAILCLGMAVGAMIQAVIPADIDWVSLVKYGMFALGDLIVLRWIAGRVIE